jgi:hypothetical protein
VREIVGFVVLQLMLALGGMGLLRSFGLVGATPRDMLPAVGAAIVTGTSAVILALVVLLVIGVPLTLATATVVAGALAGVGFGLARHRTGRDQPSRARFSYLKAAAVAATAGCAAFGAYCLAGPMGHLELRFFHAELWLLLVAVAWTAAYLLWWRCRRPVIEQLGMASLVLLFTTPFVLDSISTGYADITGSMLLGLGAMTLALWLDDAHSGHLWLGTLLLATAANTKDEDAVGAALVFLALGVALAVRVDRIRLRPWLAGAAVFAALVAPWRIWTAAHGLSDSVQPPLPHALNPTFIASRLTELNQVAQSMASNVLQYWTWPASIFLAVCVLALLSEATRRLAVFYLLSFAVIIASLLWLYATTPVDLAFLILTSVSRTVDVFMMLTPFASAHLLTKLLSTRPTRSVAPRTPSAVTPSATLQHGPRAIAERSTLLRP